ncbi:MAG: GlsB/YeaQ/YmgE family stress response membrane protein [Microbacteriaceae bacterium]|nr:GlsB/YeaQ/YmgE family stress response membrane protein [Microbacteriaceae bacterium]
MGFIPFLILGLIAGALAKLIMGKSSGGWLSTLLIGVVGALLGGWLGQVIFKADMNEFFSLESWALAVGGSVIVLALYRLLTGRK